VIGKTAEQLTLAEAVEQIYYGACCNTCRATRRIDLAKILERLGPRFLIRDVRAQLRCQTCGSRKVVITTLWKESSMSDRMIEQWK
jgi:hypothetical protein